MRDYFDPDPTEPEDCHAVVEREMRRLKLDPPPPGPGVDPKLELARHDLFWGIYPGALLGAERPVIEAGDPHSGD